MADTPKNSFNFIVFYQSFLFLSVHKDTAISQPKAAYKKVLILTYLRNSFPAKPLIYH
jgi:hypothetical protein